MLPVREGDAVVAAALDKIGAAWGVDVTPFRESGMPITRYLPGAAGRREHTDTSESGAVPNATLVLYLTDGDDGSGATVFPQVGVKVHPTRGSILSFMNHDAKGKPDKGARHGVSAVSFGARRDRIVLQIPLLQPPNQRRRVLSSGATVCSDPPEPPYTCNALTVCKSYEVETVAPTRFSDRKCANLPGFPQYPLCFCDTLANGMTSAAHGKQACMKR